MTDFNRDEFESTNVRSRVMLRHSLLDRAWNRGMEEGGVEAAEEAKSEMRQTITDIALNSEEEGRKVRGLLDASARRLEEEGSRATVAFNMVAEMEGRKDRILKTDVHENLKAKAATPSDAEEKMTPQEVGQYMLDNGLDFADENGIFIDESATVIIHKKDGRIAKELFGVDLPETLDEENNGWAMQISDKSILDNFIQFEMK